MDTHPSEYPQIIKYNGFYIGRYEAGVGTLNKNKKENGTAEEKANPFDYSVTFNENASLFNSVKTQIGIYNWSWQNYDFTARKMVTPITTGTNKAIGNVVVKADSIPYCFVDYYTAAEMSERLYRNHPYVKSGLATGTQWDMMIKYMQDNGVNVNSPDWGNFDDTSLTNLSGYYTNVIYSTNGAIIGETDGFKPAEALTTNSSTNSYVLLTTGSTEQVKKMNLYDVAGNLWEWTVETSYLDNLDYNMNSLYNSYIIRGCGFADSYQAYPVSIRGCGFAPSAHTAHGFRLALYLQ